MLIDWFTVGAQTLNFLILVWLMKHFLYKPVLSAIDEREKRIALALSDADAKKAAAQKECDDYKDKNVEFDQQRKALLNKATDEAKSERQRLLDEARREADDLIAKRQKTLQNDAHNLNQAISRRAQQEVFAIARKALTDLAETSLEERIVHVFVNRLHELGEDEKNILISTLKASHKPVIVRTTVALSPTLSATTVNVIKELLGMETQISFETAPEIISGIELTTDGHKVAWSIADYMASLEKGIDELLKEKDKSEAKSGSAASVKPEPATETQ
jgi:F-type H+-transporting ATPase subunit b